MFPHNPESHFQTPHHHKHSHFLQQLPSGSLAKFWGHPQKWAESPINRGIVKNWSETTKCVFVGYMCVILHLIYAKCFPTKFYVGKYNLFEVY